MAKIATTPTSNDARLSCINWLEHTMRLLDKEALTSILALIWPLWNYCKMEMGWFIKVLGDNLEGLSTRSPMP
ncbi:hypothetical protein GOBAR_AA02191 [Gossypium barbadense]|uniref:Uncharacterized protein n=1 Tax=Gossypium barbadense TaxID=3634 RepID=A0A2P5YS03_GOSBA|nr:hypothetical protein GOBAR_AA02191 [Gossypium barbadense]